MVWLELTECVAYKVGAGGEERQYAAHQYLCVLHDSTRTISRNERRILIEY